MVVSVFWDSMGDFVMRGGVGAGGFVMGEIGKLGVWEICRGKICCIDVVLMFWYGYIESKKKFAFFLLINTPPRHKKRHKNIGKMLILSMFFTSSRGCLHCIKNTKYSIKSARYLCYLHK